MQFWKKKWATSLKLSIETHSSERRKVLNEENTRHSTVLCTYCWNNWKINSPPMKNKINIHLLFNLQNVLVQVLLFQFLFFPILICGIPNPLSLFIIQHYGNIRPFHLSIRLCCLYSTQNWSILNIYMKLRSYLHKNYE